MHSHSRRLGKLEQAAQPPVTFDFGPVLVDMLNYGLMRAAVALIAQHRRQEARELVELASLERRLALTDAQIDGALRHIEKHLNSHLASYAQTPIRYWAVDETKRHASWHKDAAFLARNNRANDEEARYAETVEFWRQRDGKTSDEIIAEHDNAHTANLVQIAHRLVQLRLERGQTSGTDVVAMAHDLLNLEKSISPMGEWNEHRNTH